MRISGFLLVFLTFGHLWANNMAFNAGEIDFAYVAGRLAQPGVKVYDSFLLLFAMLHGVNGLRYSIEDYVQRPGAAVLLEGGALHGGGCDLRPGRDGAVDVQLRRDGRRRARPQRVMEGQR